MFSLKTHKFLLGDTTKHGYLQYTLSINKKAFRVKAHRLVALLYIPNVYNYPTVNHKDGNKLNNNVSNLEWCTYLHNNTHARKMGLNNISKSNKDRWKDDSFRSTVSKKISTTKKLRGVHRGSNNPNFRYKITCNGNTLSRQELILLTGLSTSRVDYLIKHCANGGVNKMFDKLKIQIVDTKKS